MMEFRLGLLKQLKQEMDEKIPVGKTGVSTALAVRNNQKEVIKSTGDAEEEDEDEHELRSYMECTYAPNLEIDPSLLDCTSLMNTVDRLGNFSLANTSKLEINVHVMETDQPEVTYHLSVDLETTPSRIVAEIIRAKLSALKQSDSQIDEIVDR